MKKYFFNKTITVFLTLIFITGLFPTYSFAQPYNTSLNVTSPGEVRGFNRSVFDNHFSRADREISPERWLAEAKIGITQAICAWEMIAGSLYENPLLINDAKNKLEDWSSEELEKRYSQWLISRFFSGASESAINNFTQTLDETQLYHSWRLDDEGNILFDEKTGDPLIIRPDDEGRDFSQDLLSWRNNTNENIKNTSAAFNSFLLYLYPEILTYIPEELRETMSSIINDSSTTINTSIKNEFENIAAREERKFISLRTRDNWSLRKKSDEESARIFTENLIIKTEEACKNGINEINIKIEQAAAGTGDLALLGEEWLQLYKEQFDKGLKAWEEAEERFYIKRIEWEQESLKTFSEGEKIWDDAIDKFIKQRQEWELNVKYLFETGEKLFAKISDDFEKTVKEAKKEFELNREMRIGEGTTKVKALVDMYLICSSAAISSLENVQFWHNQYKNENKSDPKNENYYSWLLEEIKNVNDSSLIEIKKSYDMYASYLEKAIEARDKILADYAALIGTADKDSAGVLKDILSPDASSEDFHLDEYQLALIRSKALVLYWEKKTEIAQAVLSYAGELSAGRMTEAEGIRAWEEAKNAYNSSLLNYETELKKLNTIGEDIQKQQILLQKLAQEMREEEEKLNQLHSDYNALVSASLVNRENYYYLEVNKIYKLLVEEYKNFQKTGNDAVYKKTLEYGLTWDILEKKETSQIILNALINGNDNGILSLSKIVESGADIDKKLRLAAIDLFADNSSGQLRSPDSAYSGADWYSKAKGVSLSEKEKKALLGNGLYERLINDYNNASMLLLEKRLNHELDSLFIIFIDDHEGEYSFLLDLCLVDAESAFIIYEILSGLKERINLGQSYYTEEIFNNEIIEEFISGVSWFKGSDLLFIDSINEINYLNSLLDIYSEYAFYSSFAKNELWQTSCLALSSLLKEYNINSSSSFLPDAKHLADSISKKQGDIFENTAVFLFNFNNCFSYSPEWLENEINNWKFTFINYIAAYALELEKLPKKETQALINDYDKLIKDLESIYLNINPDIAMNNQEIQIINDLLTEKYCQITIINFQIQMTETLEKYQKEMKNNENHWRQFLHTDFIENIDPVIASASSWKNGIIKDAYYKAAYYTNRINDAFNMYSNKNIILSNNNADFYHNIYNNSSLDILIKFNSFENQYKEIAKAARAYEYSRLPQEEIEVQLAAHEKTLKDQEVKYNKKRADYFIEANHFVTIGSLYDNQYSILKKAYEDTDNKRFLYEKQDAIQRWASTSYLNTEYTNIENCKNNLLKAQTVLDVLSDLYNNEDMRSINNPLYNELYAAYEQIFYKKLIIQETVSLITAAAAEEYANNKKLHDIYYNSLNQLGYVDQNYYNYISPEKKSEWTVKDFITVVDGRLAFSKNDAMNISGIDEKKANELMDYFTPSIYLNGERLYISEYEEAVRNLSEKMSGYFSDPNKFKQWSLARDYLLYSLISSNSDIPNLNNYYSGQAEMSSKDGSLGRLNVKFLTLRANDLFSSMKNFPYMSNPLYHYHIAWNSLSEEEKADMEFYVILMLQNDNYDAKGFSKFYTLDVYQEAQTIVNSYYLLADYLMGRWYLFANRWAYRDMRDTNRNALYQIDSACAEISSQVNTWKLKLPEYLSSIQTNALAYKNSCKNLDVLEGINENNQNITWDDIKKSLTICKVEEKKIEEIKNYWDIIQKKSNTGFKNISQALTAMQQWVTLEENNIKNNLENIWLTEKQNQKENELLFQSAADDYIAGKINLKNLTNYAKNAYGYNAVSLKTHLNNKHAVMLNDLSLYTQINLNFYTTFDSLTEEIIFLTSETLQNRYNAELAAREIEWNQIKKDLNEKENEWRITADLIMENGRADWTVNLQKLKNAYSQWRENFINEKNRVTNEWNEAYLAGLEDKETWIRQAANAANQASSEALLLLLGTEGERLSRVFDTREPFGIRDAVPDANSLMEELFKSSGISNMASAFASLNNMSNTAASIVSRGLGGVSAWDAALIRTAASDLARKSNKEIADAETRKIAHNARLSAAEAVKGLTDQVDLANKNFKLNMDDQFILKGLWSRSGNNYEKEVIKGATLFASIITEKATITGYINYKLEPIILQTNLDENYLAALDTAAIRALLDNVYLEIETITGNIFGNGEESIEIKSMKKENQRTQSPGEFGAHLGYSPELKPSDELGESKDSMFYDQGAGEIGRMMSEYIYWAVIEARGNAEVTLPPWDKRMWNDEGSWFKSPSLRTFGTIACSVVAGAVTCGAGFVGIAAVAAIGCASDVIFGALDVSFGYKSFDEVAFNVGKSLITSTVSSAIGGVFSGFGTSSFSGLTSMVSGISDNTIYQVAAKTFMTGAQTVTTSIAVNSISGITYQGGEWGYNKNVFINDFWKNTLTNSLTAMAGTFVSSGLTAINSGLNMEKLTGLNNINQSNLQKLNGFIGSLAEQGVNFAMGNDFTLNILNMGLLTNGKVKGGLLELHLGRSGVSMNFGAGGANVSFDNLISSFKGAKVWNVNTKITNYINNENNNFNSAIALRAQYGYGEKEQKSQLYEILKGNTILDTNGDGNYTAKTEINDDGKKVIHLANYQQNQTEQEQFLLALVLGHEAYRNGIVTNDNDIETIMAAAAHTQMALRMILGGENIALNETLIKDIIAYNQGTDFFSDYVNNNYDSSADYWKLVLGDDNIARFMWDGKYSFDFSLLGIEDRVDYMDDEMLAAVYNIGSDIGLINLNSSVELFSKLNSAALSLENSLHEDNKKNISTTDGRALILNFYNALIAVNSSDLLLNTDPVYANPGSGRQVFADGGGLITSQYGVRIINNTFDNHFALDLWEGNYPLIEGNRKLVAPMNGSLSLDFSNAGGLNITTSGENKQYISYGHSDASSIKDYITLFSYNGVTLNSNGSLNGISQNMIVGTMGNTGTFTKGAHVHIVYNVNGVDKNPLLFFYNEQNRGIYQLSDDAKMMSGFSGSKENPGIYYWQAQGIYNYYYTENKGKNFPNNYNSFVANNKIYQTKLNSIDSDLLRRITP